MLGVFTAYFITIVIFAGLYLTVNKVGVYYGDDTNGKGEDMDLYSTNGEGEDVDLSLGSSGANGAEVSSFCGECLGRHFLSDGSFSDITFIAH